MPEIAFGWVIYYEGTEWFQCGVIPNFFPSLETARQRIDHVPPEHPDRITYVEKQMTLEDTGRTAGPRTEVPD